MLIPGLVAIAFGVIFKVIDIDGNWFVWFYGLVTGVGISFVGVHLMLQ